MNSSQARGRLVIGMLGLAALLLCVLPGGRVEAQTSGEDRIRDALERIESGRTQPSNEGVATITEAFRARFDDYTDADRQVALDGLEVLAAGGARGGASVALEASLVAAGVLAVIALDPAIDAPEQREVADRLLRAYKQSSPFAARGALLGNLGQMIRCSARGATLREILTSLEDVATGKATVEGIAPQGAVQILSQAGGSATGVLRRIHESDSAHGQGTKTLIRELAQQDFKGDRAGPDLDGSGWACRS